MPSKAPVDQVHEGGRPATLPLVSIVVNNYNYDAFLAAAMDSALSQTYNSVEVIVVDDGSTDQSREILRRYQDRAQIILQDNRGQCQAANAGFQASHGDVIIFLDADDMLMPATVEEVMRLWEPGVSKVHFKLRAIDASGDLLPIVVPRSTLQGGDISQLLLEQGEYRTPPTSGNAFSRAALSEVLPVPVDWPSKKALDKYLLHSTPFFGPVRSYQEPLGYYRVHGNNRSQITGCDEKSISIMRAYLMEQLSVRDLIARTAAKQNLQITPAAIVDAYTFRKNRLVLKRLGVTIPSLAHESIATMAYRFILSTWRSYGLDLPSRIFLFGWALGVAFLPGYFARKLIFVGMSPISRPAWLKKLVFSFSARPAVQKGAA